MRRVPLLEVVVGVWDRILGVVQAGWEAAQTTRVNRDNFRGALGGRVNELLDAERADLFSRGEFQARNSSLLEGVIKTYEAFLLGKVGPIPQVSGGSKAWNDAAERLWRQWWEVCDYDGVSSGADKMALWVLQCWKYGEFFEQLVNDAEGAAGLPQLRLRSIHPERLEHDAASVVLNNGANGVLLSADGRRVGYRVREEVPGRLMWRHFTVPVDAMVHYFEQVEPGQLRGVPWVASALPVLADIRELDKSVLSAMRTSADMAAVMESQANGEYGLEPVALDEDVSVEIRRNSMVKIPQGWGVKQLKAEQPGLNHVEYRHDRLRELGRGRGMSLLHVLADGRDHTYSSMRGDNQMLDMVMGNDRGKFERKVLTRIFLLVMREASLMGLLPGAVPAELRVGWVWPAREYIDPMKEAQGQIASLEGGTKTMHEVCAERGVDYEEHLEVLAREVGDYEGLGLVHPMKREVAVAGAKGGEGEDSRRGAEAQRKTEREDRGEE